MSFFNSGSCSMYGVLTRRKCRYFQKGAPGGGGVGGVLIYGSSYEMESPRKGRGVRFCP